MTLRTFQVALLPLTVALILSTATTARAGDAGSGASQGKLDCALQAAADATPDAELPIVVHTDAEKRDAKVKGLAAAGFTVLDGMRSQGEILIRATGREVMVLAEDAAIQQLTLGATEANQ
jgi:hypothetical protein